MQQLEKQLSMCNDLAKKRAERQLAQFIESCEGMLLMLNEVTTRLLKDYNQNSVEIAIQYGMWARECLVDLYGPDVISEEKN